MKNGHQTFVTKDYDQFHTIEGNRVIDSRHVQRLIESMKVKDLFTPILVNKKLGIIDGQHRLEARRHLKLQVPYNIIGENYGLAEIQRLNTDQKNWTVLDYMNSYITLGLTEYETYKWFREKYKFSHHVCLRLLCQSNDKEAGVEFREGRLKIREVAQAVECADAITAYSEFYPGYKRRSFVSAMIQLMGKEQFEHERLMRGMKNYSYMMIDCQSTEQYIDLLEKIYNYNCSKKVALKYSD